MTQLPVVDAPHEEPARKVRPPADASTMAHRELLGGDFWRKIPAFEDIDEATPPDQRAKLIEIGGGTLESHQKNLTKDLSAKYRL